MADPPAGLTIRRASLDDQPACGHVFVATYRATFPDEPDSACTIETYTQSSAGEEQWVAELDGRVIGLASVYWADNFIHSLYVLPEHQGRGIGTALVDAVTRNAKGPCELKTDRANALAVAFYRRTGWREVGEGTGETGPWLRLRR